MGMYIEAKKRAMRFFEVDFLISILEKNNGNVSQSARDAGIDRCNFYRVLRRCKVHPDKYRIKKI